MNTSLLSTQTTINSMRGFEVPPSFLNSFHSLVSFEDTPRPTKNSSGSREEIPHSKETFRGIRQSEACRLEIHNSPPCTGLSSHAQTVDKFRRRVNHSIVSFLGKAIPQSDPIYTNEVLSSFESMRGEVNSSTNHASLSSI